MPSPFPGMDPYLEEPYWMNFHTRFIGEIARQLTPKLRPRFMALVEERFVIDSAEDLAVQIAEIHPDVGVVRERSSRRYSASTAAGPPLLVATEIPLRVPQHTIEIRDTRNRDLITCIEVLSPTNKRGDGRREYLSKRNRLLLSTVHLVEIDLLRAGHRVPVRDPLPPSPYFAFVSREHRRPLMETWPIELADSLPTIPTPLLPGVEDVLLDLQAALNEVYDSGGYDSFTDYSRQPDVQLTVDERKWAVHLLRTKGYDVSW